MPLTLEERERLAFVTNHPAHKVIVAALDAQANADDELRHERDMLKQDLDEAKAKLHEQTEELEVAATELESAQQKLAQRPHVERAHDPVLA